VDWGGLAIVGDFAHCADNSTQKHIAKSAWGKQRLSHADGFSSIVPSFDHDVQHFKVALPP